MQTIKIEDFFTSYLWLRRFLFVMLLVLVGILFYTRSRPIDFLINPYLGFALVFSVLITVLILLLISLVLLIQKWRKQPQSQALNNLRISCLILFTLCLISFLLLRTVALIQLHYTPEQIMNARIIGYFPSGRGGCTEWVLLLENQDRVRICRTGSAFDINTNRFLKVSVKQTAWAYEIHYLNHFSTMPDKP